MPNYEGQIEIYVVDENHRIVLPATPAGENHDHLDFTAAAKKYAPEVVEAAGQLPEDILNALLHRTQAACHADERVVIEWRNSPTNTLSWDSRTPGVLRANLHSPVRVMVCK